MIFGRRIRIAAAVTMLLFAAMAFGCGESTRKPEAAAPPALEIITLVTVEGLGRSWSDSAPPEAGPNLRELSRSVGAPVYTPCPSLVPAIASLMTGRPPESVSVPDNFGARVPSSATLLAEELRSRGWRTGAFVANPLLGKVTGLDRGFEVFDGSSADVLAGSRFYPEVRRAGRVATNAVTWIGSLAGGNRAFVWVHLSELGQPRLEAISGAAPGPRERLDAIDGAIGSLRAALRADGHRGTLLVVGDRGHIAGSEGDLGQGFFLDPEAVRVYFGEEAFGGAAGGGAPSRRSTELHARILGAASGPSSTSVAGERPAAPALVSGSSIPWIWCRWPAAVAVEQGGVLWISDGQWRRAEEMGSAAPCAENDVPPEVRALAREAVEELQAEPPSGPRVEQLRESIRKFGLTLGDVGLDRRVPAPAERRRLVGTLQRARFLAALGQLTPAVDALEPLFRGPRPLPGAILDALMYAGLDPGSQGREWELARRALADYSASPAALHWAAHAALRRQSRELAELLLQAFLERVPADADALYDLACLRSLAGDVAGTDAMLRAAAEAGFQAWDYAEVDPDLRNFRADPAYAEFRKRLGR